MHAYTPHRPLIPKPVSVVWNTGSFHLSEQVAIQWHADNPGEAPALARVADHLAQRLRMATGYPFACSASGRPTTGAIHLVVDSAEPHPGPESYRLTVAETGIRLLAGSPEGIFRGIQTLCQLAPPDIESPEPVAGIEWLLPCCDIADAPVYAWRGMMLDVARHFHPVATVKRLIDQLARFKFNKLHLHLTDDQGWRLEIKSWPALTEICGPVAVNGDPGGFYTQDDYRELVAYARSRYIDLVPEIDMPGHTNAALAAYAELNPDNVRRDTYTGIEVGFSSLMCREEVTYRFVDDVLREVAALTPGAHIHIGGDEAKATTPEDFALFIGRACAIAAKYGKTPIGWNHFERAETAPSTAVLQMWKPESPKALEKGMKVIASIPKHAYLDLKYAPGYPLGLDWAGCVPTDAAYNWDPADFMPKEQLLGVECPLWTETAVTADDVDNLVFPRLLGHAEVGWTPKDLRSWPEYRERLKAMARRLRLQGINYYADPAVAWD